MTTISPDKLKKIHAASMEILATVGIRLHLPEAVELLAQAGQKTDGDRVFLSEKFIMEQLAKAPSSFVLEAKNPDYNMTLGHNNRHYASGYGCPAITEADGTLREATISDYVKVAKLVHSSPLFKMNGGILAQPGDVPAHLASLAMVYAAMLHSDKCLFIVPEVGEAYQQLMDLGIAYWGSKEAFTAAPHTLTLISTLSPLQIDAMALNSLIRGARHNQALVVSPGPIAGATGPVTLAGNIALGNAECLTGLALAQLVQPGTAVIYGLQATTSDLRTGSIAIGTPGFSIQGRYCKALADFYSLPCRCGGGSNDAKIVSTQSAAESLLSNFTAAQNGVELMVHATGIMDAWASFSYEKFICDLEALSMIEYYLNDIEVDESTLAVDVIAEVGSGGIFLNQKHTLKRARTVPWYPKVAQRGPLGGQKAEEVIIKNAQKEMERLLNSYVAPELSDETLKNLDAVMLAAGAEKALLDSIKAGRN